MPAAWYERARAILSWPIVLLACPAVADIFLPATRLLAFAKPESFCLLRSMPGKADGCLSLNPPLGAFSS